MMSTRLVVRCHHITIEITQCKHMYRFNSFLSLSILAFGTHFCLPVFTSTTIFKNFNEILIFCLIRFCSVAQFSFSANPLSLSSFAALLEATCLKKYLRISCYCFLLKCEPLPLYESCTRYIHIWVLSFLKRTFKLLNRRQHDTYTNA